MRKAQKKVLTGDIARAAQVSQRAVQMHLKAKGKDMPQGRWAFDFPQGVVLVQEIVASRKRKSRNAYNSQLIETVAQN